MFHFPIKVTVSEFLSDLENEHGSTVAEKCRQMIAELGLGEKSNIEDLIRVVEDALSDVYQAELQEAAYWEDRPFTS